MLYVLQWSCCICSQKDAAPCAPAELLPVLRGSGCSICSAPPLCVDKLFINNNTAGLFTHALP